MKTFIIHTMLKCKNCLREKSGLTKFTNILIHLKHVYHTWNGFSHENCK